MSLIWKIPTILIILRSVSGNPEILSYKQTGIGIANSIHSGNPKFQDLINIVSLTQDGYIQFLKYIVDVPTISEFTFCIWFRSKNLTYAHPLLSYSEHETTRYIRAWISPHGKEINLAILENSVFTIASNFRENTWYHVCQSWESTKGYWSYFLNGKFVHGNFEPKLRGLKIPKGGDIVVGQEYTDFDKGLDDGIEGDIFGFNMILASAGTRPDVPTKLFTPYNIQKRAYYLNQNTGQNANLMTKQPQRPISVGGYEEVPNVLSYFSVGANRLPKGMWDDGRNLLYNILDWFGPEQRIRIKTFGDYYTEDEQYRTSLIPTKVLTLPELATKRIANNGNINDLNGIHENPLGLQLVQLSYNCGLHKGSPIYHKKVLISWTKTPVRVFGGAILKNIRPFCFKQNAG